MITWRQRLQNLRDALGRDPTFAEMLMAAEVHQLTPDEYKAQAKSWSRANKSTGDPRWD